MLQKIPFALIILRFCLSPVIFLIFWLDSHHFWYLVILTIGFLSDFFDGVIARKLKVSTDSLRSLDSWADTLFYVSIFAVSIAEHKDLVFEYWLPVVVLIALEVVRHVFDHIKFGRSASYHTWSAKMWGLFLYLGFSQLLGFSEAGLFFQLAIYVGIICDIEGLVISIVLSCWRVDVPSLYHAIEIEKLNNKSRR